MSVRVMADVWDNGPDDATLTAVLLVLANSADDNGGNCFPGNALIARRTRFSERTVIRAVVELESQGWIAVLQRRGGRPKRGARRHELAEYHTQYKINVAKLKGCQDVTVSQATSAPATEEAGPPKGCHAVTVPERKRVTVGQKSMTVMPEKGDSDDIPPDPLYGVSVTDPSGEPNHPLPLPREEGERHADPDSASAFRPQIDAVMQGCGFSARRLRRVIGDQLQAEVDCGRSAASASLAMIAAWRSLRDYAHLLRHGWGAGKFFGEGHWRGELPWDQRAIERERMTSVARIGVPA